MSFLIYTVSKINPSHVCVLNQKSIHLMFFYHTKSCHPLDWLVLEEPGYVWVIDLKCKKQVQSDKCLMNVISHTQIPPRKLAYPLKRDHLKKTLRLQTLNFEKIY